MQLSRRDALRAFATGAAAVTGAIAFGGQGQAAPAAGAPTLGTLLDYSAGIPSPAAMRPAARSASAAASTSSRSMPCGSSSG